MTQTGIFVEMHMSRHLFPAVCVFVLTCAQGLTQNEQSEPLERKLEYYIRLIESSDQSVKNFIALGPGVVPVILKMLNQETGTDRKIRMIGMLGNALVGMPVPQEDRTKAVAVLYEQLKSPDERIRTQMLFTLPQVEGNRAADRVIPLLDDEAKGVRIFAAMKLSEIGGPTTAEAINSVMIRRSKGLTKEQLDNDKCFRYGYRAIEVLNRKYSPDRVKTPDASTPKP